MEIFELDHLFEAVQLQKIFPDGKTFVDCTPKKDLEEIATQYENQKANPGFDLKEFVLQHFELPHIPDSGFAGSESKTITEHIESLWTVLTRKPDTQKGSLIPLPYSYIVPGGRFGEIYYWDSYFTMLGLRASGRIDMIENMVNNFSHLIDTIGFIPNGNRTYYTGRSQPPFFSLMVRLLSEEKGKKVLINYLPQLEKEYNFWMVGSEILKEENIAAFHVVQMPDGELLNRYWDKNDTPRPESYREDVELALQSKQNSSILYRHLRAGAESGWDYSSRWFADGRSFDTIHTTDIVPVDLNCLLWHLEKTIAEACELNKEDKKVEQYKLLAEKRKAAIQKYCWNDAQGFYVDYDFVNGKQKHSLTLGGVTPLFFKIATDEQAKRVAVLVKEKLLKPGGVVTTLETTGQQWDAPNGWAPLQWMTVKGLENYDLNDLAKEIALCWIKLNDDVYKRTGKLMEKYNVVDTELEAGGGEYEGQDGFGWTNGVLLALIKKYGIPELKVN
ncbi:MAG: alpha,alpha-trehalase TreF [Bacteroidetes bacterium]|nr:MAG: alpha,alpha-trehalase TreF [Bacteroidota bacterium]